MKPHHLIGAIILGMATMAMSSCSDGKSYAQLLNEEDMYTNNYLADHYVELSIPADTVFEVGPDAPYYRLDEDGMLYMQVLRAGTKGNKVESDEQIYFRYTRYPLSLYSNGVLPSGEGNNITLSPAWFRFNPTSGASPTNAGSKEVVGDDAAMVNPTIIRGVCRKRSIPVLGEDALYIRCVLSEDNSTVCVSYPTNNRGANNKNVLSEDFPPYIIIT